MLSLWWVACQGENDVPLKGSVGGCVNGNQSIADLCKSCQPTYYFKVFLHHGQPSVCRGLQALTNEKSGIAGSDQWEVWDCRLWPMRSLGLQALTNEKSWPAGSDQWEVWDCWLWPMRSLGLQALTNEKSGPVGSDQWEVWDCWLRPMRSLGLQALTNEKSGIAGKT